MNYMVLYGTNICYRPTLRLTPIAKHTRARMRIIWCIIVYYVHGGLKWSPVCLLCSAKPNSKFCVFFSSWHISCAVIRYSIRSKQSNMHNISYNVVLCAPICFASSVALFHVCLEAKTPHTQNNNSNSILIKTKQHTNSVMLSGHFLSSESIVLIWFGCW